MRPRHALYLTELHSDGAPLPRGAFDGKISQRGLTLPTSTIRPLSHGAHSLHASSRILPGVAATNAGNYDTL